MQRSFSFLQTVGIGEGGEETAAKCLPGGKGALVGLKPRSSRLFEAKVGIFELALVTPAVAEGHSLEGHQSVLNVCKASP